MINKATGYSGFKSYAEQPYPTRKQGKELQLTNKVWESTVRSKDYINPLQNYHNIQTVYKKQHLENTQPEHYHPEHVPRGANRTLNFQGTGTIPAYDREQAEKYKQNNNNGNNLNGSGSGDPRKNRLLQTGTEHWRSVYNNTLANTNGINGINGTNGNTNGQSGINFNTSNALNGRSQSIGGKTQAQIAQEQARANSYKVKPYINNAKTGVTDYKFNYGEKIGQSPFTLMDRVSIKQPLRDHPLKRGTNQLWTQIPNYQGFKPSELNFKDYRQKIDRRNQTNKGNLKLQTAQNFLIHPPGYGGFKPQFQKTTTQLRSSCLGNNQFQ